MMRPRWFVGGAVVAFPLALALADAVEGWVPGPVTATMGENVATIRIDEGHVFADATATRRFLEANGNPTDGSEVGMIAPIAEDASWFAIFEYAPVGYVKDDDRDIDTAAILESIQRSTEKSNAWRKEHGVSALHVVGWQEAPHYDATTNNLTWATLAKDDDGDEVVNHNVRLLGRHGYMSVTLVDAPNRIAASKVPFTHVLGGFQYESGKRYAEYVSGDKLAGYGLAALVAGGAAAKLGVFAALWKFLAKSWKLVLIGLASLGAALMRILRRLFGSERITMPDTSDR